MEGVGLNAIPQHRSHVPSPSFWHGRRVLLTGHTGFNSRSDGGFIAVADGDHVLNHLFTVLPHGVQVVLNVGSDHHVVVFRSWRRPVDGCASQPIRQHLVQGRRINRRLEISERILRNLAFFCQFHHVVQGIHTANSLTVVEAQKDLKFPHLPRFKA